GKSILIAAICKGAIGVWPDHRILVVTHVRELIEQNHAELLALWPEAPAGICSAGLGRRDLDAQVLFAGIQSVGRRVDGLGRADLVLVDEAHLISRTSSTVYRTFLRSLEEANPAMRAVGLTATPWRLDSGRLDEGEDALFDDIVYDAGIADMITAGWLAPVVP